MQFNSIVFLVFLAIALAAYYLAANEQAKRWLIIAASIVFLYWAGWFSLAMIVVITFSTYCLALVIEENSEGKKGAFWLAAGIALLVANLAVFKYHFFFGIETLLAALFQGRPGLDFAAVALPLGISFYTFQLLGYLVDVRLGRIKAERNLGLFSQYVFFFPKLTAGPIERAQAFLPQCRTPKKFDPAHIAAGGKLLIFGLFKKMVIGDRIAIYTDMIYGNIDAHGGLTLALTAVMYVFQIYADFSGYTDIARGVARLFGYTLMENFRRPLLAASVTEFWRRWHISLSSWVNDYIYTPIALALRRFGKKGTLTALFLAFVLIGVWHGANWTFVAFGLLQGLLIMLEYSSLRTRKKLIARIPAWLVAVSSVAFTFLFIAFSLILFRAPSLSHALLFISRFSVNAKLFVGSSAYFIYAWLGIGFLILQDVMAEYRGRDILQIRSPVFIIRNFPYALLLVAILALGVLDGGQFIYFQF